MKKRACFVILVATLLSWVCVTSMPFAHHHHQQAEEMGQNPNKGANFDSKQGDEDGEYHNKSRRLSRLGSRPPNCEHKCEGCDPCVAVQIPTKTDHFGVQYANYEPEGWKCKCGSSYFNP